MAMIPQCDPRASYLARKLEIDDAILRVLSAGRYILGPEVEAFESEFAATLNAGQALGVASGTDALELALRATGIGPGDVVLTVAHTAVATTVAIRATGASPLYVDVDPEHGLIDPRRIEETLAAASKGALPVTLASIRAVVPVHLYGRCADMPAIMDLARSYDLRVIEDCAQAHGAVMDNRAAGTWGDCGSFSFYPTKNLGAFGDGGALVSANPALLAQARLLREYGWRRRYVSDIEGVNSRLDELQAAILRVKLVGLADANARRVALASIYRDGLNNAAVTVAGDSEPGRHVYHQFVVRCPDREGLRVWLGEQDIGTLVHYPTAIHQQPAYANPDFAPLPLPHTEHWAREVVSLPIFPELPIEDARRVVDVVNAWQPKSG
jgi:dTDP-4-amino-4,6-dideoxygalactose transaminase